MILSLYVTHRCFFSTWFKLTNFKNKNINFLQHDSFDNLFPILSSEKTMPEMKRAGKNT